MNLLQKRAREHPDRRFLLDPRVSREWSFREACEQVKTVETFLHEQGFEPGDRLGVVLEPGPEFAWLYFASIHRGLELIPINPDAPDARKRALLENLDTPVVATPPDAGTLELPGTIRRLSLDSLTANRGSEPPPSSPDRHRLIIHTSGTTGRPKPVPLTLSNMLASARSSRARLGCRFDDLWLSPLSVHHVGGVAPLIRSLLNGSGVVPVPCELDRLETILDQFPITAVSLVPRMLRVLLEGDLDPSPLRFVLLGGAPAPPDLRHSARRAGYPIHPTYGMTETASQVATANPQEALEHPTTVGEPLRDATVTIRGPEGEKKSPGESGEITVRGPMVCEGYLGQPEETDRRFRDGEFRTGDRGYRDEAGRLYVTGRMDRRILTGGETVDPREVESVLENHPAIRESHVFGRKDEKWGEIVCAALRTAEKLTPDELDEFLENRLDRSQRPRDLRIFETFPRTATGTVNEDELLQQWPQQPRVKS